MNFLLSIPQEFKNELRNIVRSVIEEELREFQRTNQPKENSSEDYLNINEACDFLDCSKTTLYHYRRKGLINYHQVGKKIFFKKEDLLTKIKARTK